MLHPLLRLSQRSEAVGRLLLLMQCLGVAERVLERPEAAGCPGHQSAQRYCRATGVADTSCDAAQTGTMCLDCLRQQGPVCHVAPGRPMVNQAQQAASGCAAGNGVGAQGRTGPSEGDEAAAISPAPPVAESAPPPTGGIRLSQHGYPRLKARSPYTGKLPRACERVCMQIACPDHHVKACCASTCLMLRSACRFSASNGRDYGRGPGERGQESAGCALDPFKRPFPSRTPPQGIQGSSSNSLAIAS